MKYQEAFKILDLKSLNGFVDKTKSLALTPSEGVFTGDPEGYMDPEFYWKITVESIERLGWSLQDIGAKIYLLAWGIKDVIKAWWHNLSLILFKRAKNWWDHFLETFKGLAWDISYEFKKFVRDPGGYIYDKVKKAIQAVGNAIKITGAAMSQFVSWMSDTVKTFIKQVFANWWDSIRGKIDQMEYNITNWWRYTWQELTKIGVDIKMAVVSAIQDMPVAFNAPTQTIKNWIDNAKDIIVKTFDYGLGGLINTFKDFLSGIFDRVWNWFVGLLNKVAKFINQNVILPLWNIVKGAWSWLVSFFTSLWQDVKNLLFSLAPSAPEKGEELMVQGLKLLGVGVSAFGALTGLSMVVSWLSKHHLGHLSAILYDMSSYKYITGALVGGLVTAAYAQPLKYFYNAKFRPYLPKFADVHSALGRSIISLDEFKFHLKYAGIPDKYTEMYQRLAQKPISAFMIRYIAEAEITDPQGIFSICMDNGYSVEHSAYMAFALSWGANSSYRKAAESVIRRCFKEGFIDKTRMDKAINEVRAIKEVPVSYTTIDGYTYTATIKVPLDQKTLMKITAEWEAFYDSMNDKVSTLRSAFAKEKISEDELRDNLRALGIVETKIEDIVAREKAKKRVKTEPDRGKTLRDELKSVLRRCYKEGFITAEYLDRLLDETNKVVDEKELIKQRANWEAFYDDMMDLVKIYKENLENGIIDDAIFRRDLIDLGLRPEKVELMIKYIQAKKTGRIKE